MTDRINAALELYSEDPEGAAKALRTLIDGDPSGFVQASALLLERDSPGCQHLVPILARNIAVVPQLCDPELLDRETAIELARRIVTIDPRLDTKLVLLLPGRGSENCDIRAEVAQRVLEILGAISTGTRIAPLLAHLTGHPNERLRAKVLKLIGYRVRNVRLVEERLKEADPRVRANAVESLWGEKELWAARLLWKAVEDANNRVIGNALFGLYDLGDEKIVPHILRMGEHPTPLFRSTAAWTMGHTGDPQFLPALEKLNRDLYAAVRKAASRAIEKIGKREVVEASLEATVSQNQ
jgi:HEAT repeat protein